MDVEQQGARGVAGVGAVHPAAGEAPEQEAVHRAEAQLATLGPLAGAGHLVEEPTQLGGGEVRIKQQAGLRRHPWLMAGGPEHGAVGGGAAVLPDDGRMDQRAAGRLPHQGGLALVGDADGGDLPSLQTGLTERRPAHLQHALPDLFAVVLDPAVAGEMLAELLLGLSQHPAGSIEDDGAAAGGALVDGEQMGGHGGTSVWRQAPRSAQPAGAPAFTMCPYSIADKSRASGLCG
ncbi:hypothetical protein D3C75_830450 [compost metagenome]